MPQQRPSLPRLDVSVTDVDLNDEIIVINDVQPHELSSLLTLFRPNWRIVIDAHGMLPEK